MDLRCLINHEHNIVKTPATNKGSLDFLLNNKSDKQENCYESDALCHLRLLPTLLSKIENTHQQAKLAPAPVSDITNTTWNHSQKNSTTISREEEILLREETRKKRPYRKRSQTDLETDEPSGKKRRFRTLRMATCPYLGCNRYMTMGNLRVHARVHTKERPFTCAGCNCNFSWRTSFEKHQIRCLKKKIGQE